MSKKIRVLIVDDSSIIRALLTRIFEGDPEFEVVGTAPDPYVAREKLIALKPDVITLDIEMPRMDGLQFLEKIMKFMPTRTVMISSLSQKNSQTAFRAFELGAIDVIAKPTVDTAAGLALQAQEIKKAVKNASLARLIERTQQPALGTLIKKNSTALAKTTDQIIAIASSTGGTEALKVFLSALPADIPGIIIVQHIPPVFSANFAKSLDAICPFEVKEAEAGDRVSAGRVLIAPGNFHMTLSRSGAFYEVKLNQDPQIHGVRPAADILFHTVAKIAGANAVGVVLTGMGKDGAKGLLEMKEAGSTNFAQDEQSCVVFGMPKEAIERGAIHHTLPLTKMADAVVNELKNRGWGQ